MFNFFKKKEESKIEKTRIDKGPLKTGIGGVIDLDTLSLRASLAGQDTAIKIPDMSRFVIAGVGQTMLDADMQLTRYYDDEDRMIQVMGSPGCDEEDIVDATFFIPWDSVVPANSQEWKKWTGYQGLLGAPTYDADGILYERFWGDGQGHMDPVEFTEEVEADGVTRQIHQKCMLYARDFHETAREMLLILTQRDLEGKAAESGASIEFMIGYGLNVADMKSI